MYKAKKFFKENWDQKSPLLLGYSGGPDSKALLFLLLEMGIFPHLAHVDHGWREESAQEASILAQEAQQLGLPFHTVRLSLKDFSEVEAREKRLEFFASLFKKIPYQALLLGHQADDLAETALKRVLEGAHLVHLGGMRGVSEFVHPVGLLQIWRPLLDLTRLEILAFLKEKEVSALQDSTNFNPAYLRARMRSRILPDLSVSFGKGVSTNLTLLGNRANELKEYFDRKTDLALQSMVKGPWGLALTLDSQEPMEVRHLLQRTGVRFTRDLLEALVTALIQRLPNRKFGLRMVADRGVFFYLEDKMPCFGSAVSLQKGVFSSGDWEIVVEESQEEAVSSTWRDVWTGKFSMTLPWGKYQLDQPKSLTSLRKRLNERQVPAFFRPLVPQFCEDGARFIDLLSGHTPLGKGGFCIRFSVNAARSSSKT